MVCSRALVSPTCSTSTGDASDKTVSRGWNGRESSKQVKWLGGGGGHKHHMNHCGMQAGPHPSASAPQQKRWMPAPASAHERRDERRNERRTADAAARATEVSPLLIICECKHVMVHIGGVMHSIGPLAHLVAVRKRVKLLTRRDEEARCEDEEEAYT